MASRWPIPFTKHNFIATGPYLRPTKASETAPLLPPHHRALSKASIFRAKRAARRASVDPHQHGDATVTQAVLMVSLLLSLRVPDAYRAFNSF